MEKKSYQIELLGLKGLCRCSNQTYAFNKRFDSLFRALAAAFALRAMNAVEVLPPCVTLGITAWRER